MSTSTHDVPPDPALLEPQHESNRRRGGKRIAALAAAVLALVLIAALLIVQSRDEAPSTDQPPVAAAPDVAKSFLDAFGAFDVERARTYLADDATIASLGAQDDLRLLSSWLEATGYRQIVDSCEGGGDSVSGSVRCTFDFHALRSSEIGRGPFSGSSFDLDVRDGKIVQVAQHWEIAKFSPQVWEPFANWVSKAHPKDAAVMYTDESYSNVRLTRESIRLWELRTLEYVEKVGR